MFFRAVCGGLIEDFSFSFSSSSALLLLLAVRGGALFDERGARFETRRSKKKKREKKKKEVMKKTFFVSSRFLASHRQFSLKNEKYAYKSQPSFLSSLVKTNTRTHTHTHTSTHTREERARAHHSPDIQRREVLSRTHALGRESVVAANST